MARAKTDPMLELLQGVPIFSDLSQKELKVIRGIAREYSFAPGDLIIEQGKPDKRMHIILDGEAEILVGGKSQGFLGTGDHFGEIAILDGGPRTATIVAKTPVRTLSHASFTLLPTLRANPDILLKLLTVVCARLREADAKLTQ